MTVAFGVWACSWGSNFGFLHWLALSPLQHSRTTVRVCDFPNSLPVRAQEVWPPGSADTVCLRPPLMTQVQHFVFRIKKRHRWDVQTMWAYDLDVWPWRSWRLSLIRVVVLSCCHVDANMPEFCDCKLMQLCSVDCTILLSSLPFSWANVVCGRTARPTAGLEADCRAPQFMFS